MSETVYDSRQAAWQLVSLGQLQAPGGIQGGPFGSQLHARDYVSNGIPLIMPKNIGKNGLLPSGHDFVRPEDARRLSVHRVELGDIVIGRKGDLSRRALVREAEQGWICGTDCIRIRVNQELVSPTYLSYYMGLKSISEWLHRHDTGSTLPSLNTANLGRLPVRLPPRRYQAIVGQLLEALDRKILINSRIALSARELAQAHFVVTSRRAVSRTGLRYLVDLRYGKALPEINREPGPIPVYGGNGISGSHRVSLTGGPGIIVGRKGANAGSVSWSQGPFWAIDTAFYVKPISQDLPLEYLFFLLEAVEFRHLVGDSAIPGLNRETALTCAVPLPPRDVIDGFVATVRPLVMLQAHMSIESTSLANLRDTLLPRLMSGEIRVRDAEKIVGDVT
jgi:type I restriction enzyme S subunit